MLADPTMPFLRAPKGTIQRQATLNIYEDKINKMYLESDSDTTEAMEMHDLHISDSAPPTEKSDR